MNGSSSHSNYSAADIRRYHAGEMTLQERHALESAALDDPFLADALEGYVHTKTPEADLRLLHQKLFASKSEEAKVVPIRSGMIRWMSIAALLVVMAGGGWLVYQFLYQPSATEVARQQPQPETVKPPVNTLQAPNLDSLVTGNTIAATDSVFISPTGPAYYGDTMAPPSRTDLALQRTGRRTMPNPESTKMMNVDSTNLPAAASSTAIASDANVTLNNIVVAQSDSATKNDVAIIRQSKDSLEVNITMKANVDADKNLDVVGLSANNRRQRARPEMQTFTQELEPNQAWNSFNDYVTQNLKEPEKYRTKESTTNEVVLSFDVSENGDATNITVVRSSCTSCNREAIRLLKAGPKWKRSDQKKGMVTIRF